MLEIRPFTIYIGNIKKILFKLQNNVNSFINTTNLVPIHTYDDHHEHIPNSFRNGYSRIHATCLGLLFKVYSALFAGSTQTFPKLYWIEQPGQTEENSNYIGAASSEFGAYRPCEQRRFRRACASAQSRQNLRCSLI